MRKGTILIFEPHPYHYEVIPGVAYYFDYFGYKVELLVQNNFVLEDVFARSILREKIIVHNYEVSNMKEELREKYIGQYDFLFLNSMEYFHGSEKERLLDYLGYIPKTQYGILGIYHNKDVMNDSDIALLKENRLFALTPFKYKNYSVNLLSACYFGEIEKKDVINSKIKIVMIGMSNNRVIVENALSSFSHKQVKNIKIDVIGKINLKKDFVKRLIMFCDYYKSVWLGNGHKNQKVSILGWKRVSYLGKLSFANMYQQIEEADYIAIVLDPECDKDKPFLDGKTSGSKQLALGFSKPCIINDKYATSFGFSEENSIIYHDNNITDAIMRVCKLSQEEYESLSKNVAACAKKLRRESVRNLQETLLKCIDTGEIK